MNILLLDRDGVLVQERTPPYVPAHMALLPGVPEGLRALPGFRKFIISNQSAVGRGISTREDVEACNRALVSHLNEHDIAVDDVTFCPHHPDDNCSCRKPKTGLWEELARKHGLRADQCVWVGNRETDVRFGRAIGCYTVLVEDPAHPLSPDDPQPDLRVKNLMELAEHLADPPWKHRVLSVDDAAAQADRRRGEGRRIVTTNGAFDLLHPGHLFLIREARKHGDVLIVGVNSDASVKRYKGPDRPLEPQSVRMRKVAEHADMVFLFDEDDPRAWLPRIRPHVHVNAAAYGKDCIEAPVLREIGAELVLVPFQPELGSTTEILRRRS